MFLIIYIFDARRVKVVRRRYYQTKKPGNQVKSIINLAAT